MTIHRNPIPGRAFPPPLRCVGATCQAEQQTLEVGDRFRCPNVRAANHQCEVTSFLYPRKKRDARTFHSHQGIDIGGEKGVTEIVSVVSGTVVHANDSYAAGYGGYGKCVVIRSEEGLFFLHAHCEALRVAEGDSVSEQQVIAIVGCTDYTATNPTSEMAASRAHLHFEVSRSAYPKPTSAERDATSSPPYSREDPLEILESLGPWGGPVAPPLFFPNGHAVLPASIEQRHQTLEGQALGGYFPIGANNFWHGGVHLFGASGELIKAPFDASIVAVRLDEQAEHAVHDFGCTNFILLKHQIPEILANRLAPRPTPRPADGGHSGATPSRDPQPRTSVGEGGANLAEYVIEVKRMLHTHARPDGAPFYVPADPADLESSTLDAALIPAIRAFQQRMIDARRAPPRMTADGLIGIPNGPTWRALRAGAPVPPAPLATASDTSAPAAPPPSPPPGAVVYMLFMHVQPRTVDAGAAEQIPWLTRASLRSEDERAQAEERRRNEESEERSEARYRMTGDVGPGDNSGNENLAEDVRWIECRLKRFELYPGEPSGVMSPGLLEAIANFQTQHVPAFRRTTPDRVVSRNAGTYRQLCKTPRELGVESDDDSALDSEFLAKLRERETDDMAKVVSNLAIPVTGGEVLWSMGEGGADNLSGLIPLVHWEVFSEQPLMPAWTQLEDTDQNLTIDASPQLLAEVEAVEELDDDDQTLSANEVTTYYMSGRGAHLRELQCRFHSEWGVEPSAVEQAFADLGDPLATHVRDQVAPYLWWSKAADVLPPSPLVWHYNPIAFMAEYARASGAFNASLRIAVERGGDVGAGVRVQVTAPRQTTRDLTTRSDGTALLRGLTPATYHVSASTAGEPIELRAEQDVTVAPGEEGLVRLVLQPVVSCSE
jgi:murein DD-endopeptidase MepM/ murein hydrolase activator NlpD